MPDIHPTAIIHPGAVLGEGCVVGPYAVVGAHVVLGPRCRLHAHAIVDGHTVMGSDNEVFPFACIGGKTQDLKYKGGVAFVEIGDHNVFRECCTVHAGTAEGAFTRVGSRNNFLATTHIAHDCQVGSHVIMSNLAAIAGHVVVEDHAVLGGMAAVHQFVRIGRYAMVGGCTKVVQDIAPFMMVDGNPAETRFVNKVGLERGGFSEDAIAMLTRAYKVFFRSGLTTANAIERAEAELGMTPELRHLVGFARASQRGLTK